MKGKLFTLLTASLLVSAAWAGVAQGSIGVGIGSIDIIAPKPITADENVTIASGVYCGGMHLGGLKPAQAREQLGAYFENVAGSTLTFAVDSIKYETTLENLGFTYDIETAIAKASRLGQYGLLMERYKTLQDLKFDKVSMDISCSIDQEKAETYIKEHIAANDTPAKDASIERKNGKFIVTREDTGVATDIEGTLANLNTAMQNPAPNLTVQIAAEVAKPAVTETMLEAIDSRLGTYSTNYERSAAGRKNNVKLASSNINGTVVMPGESFSTSTAMKERSAKNGYQMATEYNNGETKEAIGGGVCQVATTLYNAVLRAELQVNKRYNHSMLVSYVEPSFDAAIANGNKDFVFTNNTEYPIYIAASADGVNVTFSIYGHETRPSNRKIEFESVTVERITSQTIEVLDPTKPADFIEKKGSNHDKCTSYLLKKVYIDGKLTEKIKISSDEYNPSYETVTKGTMPVEPTESPIDTPTEAPGQDPTQGTEAAG